MTVKLVMNPVQAVELVLRKSRDDDYNLQLAPQEIGSRAKEYVHGVLTKQQIMGLCEALVKEGRAHLASSHPLAYCWGTR
jgi:hypothetical protein